MSDTLTKELLVDAIQKSKATTISGVWRYLGHKSSISGSQGKRIRELVPNHLELLEANKNGTLVQAKKTPVTVVQAEKTPVTVVKDSTTPAPKKEKGAGGFRNGSNYAVLFAEGNKEHVTRDQLVARVAKLTNRSEKLVMFDYYVMSNKTHKSNGGRAMIDETSVTGKVKIVPQT